MKRIQIVGTSLILVLLFIAACAPATPPAPAAQAPTPAVIPAPAPAMIPARPAWQVEWERVLEAGKKEGRFSYYTSVGSEQRSALVEGFKQAAYGIPVESVSGRGAELHPKALAERRAGLYFWDLYLGGITSVYSDLEPAGAVEPLDPALILPDVTDPALIKKIWYRGELWWCDRDHLVLAALMFPYPTLYVNTNLVKPGEIKSYNDLLDPKWKGKIVMDDPTLQATTFPHFMKHIFGLDWLRNLAKQEPIIMRDKRVQIEWLAHAKASIAIGSLADPYFTFKKAGAPVQAIIPQEGAWFSTFSSGMSIFNRAPHPNAAKVFINWLLSKEGQTVMSRVHQGQSVREDVPTDFLPPESIRQPGVKYWEKEQKEVQFKIMEDTKLMKEIFAHLLK